MPVNIFCHIVTELYGYSKEKKKMDKWKTRANIVLSVMIQITNIVCGFILPRAILSVFGSEVNGLLSSLSQFLSYINLLEGGITGVITACLYKPIVEKNELQLNRVVRTAQIFFRKIAIIFLIYTFLVAIFYPVIVKTELSFSFVCLLTLILSINLFIQYFFSIVWKLLLTADNRVYIISAIQIIVVILNTTVSVWIMKKFPDIHFVKLVSAGIYLLQPIGYSFFVHKYFKINKNIGADKEIIAQRWNGFAISLAAFIHNNTDMVLLSLFGTLSEVSVYSVYFLVVSGLKSLVISVSNAISPRIGQLYAAGDKKQLKIAFEKYERIILFVTYFLFTVGGLCITSFVQLYTNGIKDTNYNRPVFGTILVLAEMLFCIRDPYVSLAYVANRFKNLKKIAYIEAGLNICISVILVNSFGISGVAMGTLISMLFRTVVQILYLHFHILHKKVIGLFKNILVFSGGAVIVVGVSHMTCVISQLTIFSWLVYAAKNAILAFLVYASIYISLCKVFSRVDYSEEA